MTLPIGQHRGTTTFFQSFGIFIMRQQGCFKQIIELKWVKVKWFTFYA